MALRFRILAAASAPRGQGSDRGPSDTTSALARGPSQERTFEIATELDQVSIGRRPGVEIELPFPGVSSLHARLYRGGDLPGDWWAEDLGSTNGSWLDGRRLGPRRPVALRAGQRLRIATVDLVFDGWSATAGGAESTATIARRLISDLFGVVGGDVPALTAESGPALQPSVSLVDRDRHYLAGRAEGCDLVLPSEHVSREHAAFTRRWDGVTVQDLGSKNGVVVNGFAISGERKLADGDRIEIGPIALRLTDPEDRYLRHLQQLSGDPVQAPGGEDAFTATRPGEEIVAAPPPASMVTGWRQADHEREHEPDREPDHDRAVPDPSARASGGPLSEASVAAAPPANTPVAAPVPAGPPAAGGHRSPTGLIASVAALAVVIALVGLVSLLVATR